jgi:hypothetical protein
MIIGIELLKAFYYDTSTNFATDINAAVYFLTNRGYANIGLIGHSE